jgi:uncharacterized protein involved in exopolysaccharide biosynthesis
MQTASAQPAAVLDYASSQPQQAVIRRLRGLAIVLLCMLLLGGAGYIFQPDTYRATALLQVDLPPNFPAGAIAELNPSVMRSQQTAAVAGLVSPTNLNAAAATLAARGIALTPSELTARIKVDPIKESRLIRVTFDDGLPRDAAMVANAVINSYTAPGVTVVVTATPPARPQRDHFYTIAGLAVGFLVGVAITALRWK